jgi:hypothetical protein
MRRHWHAIEHRRFRSVPTEIQNTGEPGIIAGLFRGKVRRNLSASDFEASTASFAWGVGDQKNWTRRNFTERKQ